NDAYSLTVTRTYLMLFLAESGEPEPLEESAGIARQLIDLGAMNASIGVATGTLARVLMMQGRLTEARETAERALAILEQSPAYQASTWGAVIETRVREGRPDEIRKAADDGVRYLEAIGGSCFGDVRLRLTIAEAWAAAGDMSAARAALAEALRVIEA